MNNVEPDHLECYGSVAALEDCLRRVRGRGPSWCSWAPTIPGALRVAGRVGAKARSFGLGGPRGHPHHRRDTGARRDPGPRDSPRAPESRHRAAPGARAPQSPERGRGAGRRGTCRAGGLGRGSRGAPGVQRASAGGSSGWVEFGGVEIVDDYAHHPSELVATLAAARQAFPGPTAGGRLSAAPLLPHGRARRRHGRGARRGGPGRRDRGVRRAGGADPGRERPPGGRGGGAGGRRRHLRGGPRGARAPGARAASSRATWSSRWGRATSPAWARSWSGGFERRLKAGWKILAAVALAAVVWFGGPRAASAARLLPGAADRDLGRALPGARRPSPTRLGFARNASVFDPVGPLERRVRALGGVQARRGGPPAPGHAHA